ncbi:MAG TPA: YoaK family protein [Solirubrobacteraceae bacterium]
MSATAPPPVQAWTLRHPLVRMLLGLTFTTGLIDAASYLGLGHVFTANMTGNIVLLGFGIAGSAGLPVLSPIVSLAAFLIGAVAGGLLSAKTFERHALHVGSALAIECSLVAVAAILAAAIGPHPNTFAGDLLVAVLAFTMGSRNAAVRKLAVPDLNTTVLTMTLTGLAADSRLAEGSGRGTTRRVGAVIAMLSGAIAGALLLKSALWLPLALASVLALVAWLGYVPRAPRTRPGT